MQLHLSSFELRVLGVLMEKQVTVPDSYPMSPNSIRLGCNQKNSRYPLMELSERDVEDTISSLRDKRLVTVVHESGARVPKYAQVLNRELKLEPQHNAVMCVLMLRGAQTPGELRTRCEPMFKFDSLEAAEKAISDLNDWVPDPLTQMLERQAGESTVRFAHLLGDVEVQRIASSNQVVQGPAATERIAVLEAEVAALRQELNRIKRELGLDG